MCTHLISRQTDSIIEYELNKKFNMTFADFNILRAIFVLGPCTQVELAHYNLVTEAAVSKRIRKLIKDNLISRNTHRLDTRKRILTLTPRGKIIIEKIQNYIIKKMEEIFSEIKQEERKEILLYLKKMLNELILNKNTLQNTINKFYEELN